MAFTIKYDENKNQLLKATRQVCFEDGILSLENGQLLADIRHPSKARPAQRIFVVLINGYAHAMPYVMDMEKEEIFLKTIYPSRSLNEKYVKGEEL